MSIMGIGKNLGHNRVKSGAFENSIIGHFFSIFLTCAWSEGYIVPLYKSGCRSDPGNYRGICISSCLGKFFTSILNYRLNTFLEEHDILNIRVKLVSGMCLERPIIYLC